MFKFVAVVIAVLAFLMYVAQLLQSQALNLSTLLPKALGLQ